jgi:hypothetical protein
VRVMIALSIFVQMAVMRAAMAPTLPPEREVIQLRAVLAAVQMRSQQNEITGIVACDVVQQ